MNSISERGFYVLVQRLRAASVILFLAEGVLWLVAPLILIRFA